MLRTQDNYCHGLIIAEAALFRGSPACGQFYIVTDGIRQTETKNPEMHCLPQPIQSNLLGDTHYNSDGYCLLYDCLEEAALKMGFASIKAKICNERIIFLFLFLLTAADNCFSVAVLVLDADCIRLLFSLEIDWYSV